MEGSPLGLPESTLGYHPSIIGILTGRVTIAGTVLGGQFDWGGRLPNGNGGAQRFVQYGRKSCSECKRRNEPNCDTDGWSSNESWS